MSIRIINHTCENCGGDLILDMQQKSAICPYCGSVYQLEENLPERKERTVVSPPVTTPSIYSPKRLPLEETYNYDVFKEPIRYDTKKEEKSGPLGSVGVVILFLLLMSAVINGCHAAAAYAAVNYDSKVVQNRV